MATADLERVGLDQARASATRAGRVPDASPRHTDPVPQAAEGGRARRRPGPADAAAPRPHRGGGLRGRGERALRPGRLGRRRGRRLHRVDRRRRTPGSRQEAGARRTGRGLPDAAVGPRRLAPDCGRRRAGNGRGGRRLRLPRTADPRLLRQADRGQHHRLRDEPAAPVLRRASWPTTPRPTSPSTARGTRAVSSTGSPPPASSSSSTSGRGSSATTSAMPTWTSATC